MADKYRIRYVNRDGVWADHDTDGVGRHFTDLYARSLTAQLATENLTDRVQWLSAGEAVAEFAREPGDQGALRPVERITEPGVVGEPPAEEAVPISRAVLNSRSRMVSSG